MDSAFACAHAPDAPHSSAVGRRDVRNSLPSHGFVPLRSSSSFSTIYRVGIGSRRGALLVLQAAGPEGPPSVGVVAGRKVGNAVRRNRAKRLMREAARRADLVPNTQYVLVASRDLDKAGLEAMVVWLGEALEANAMKTSRERT